jgi:hypothetical protein
VAVLALVGRPAAAGCGGAVPLVDVWEEGGAALLAAVGLGLGLAAARPPISSWKASLSGGLGGGSGSIAAVRVGGLLSIGAFARSARSR